MTAIALAPSHPLRRRRDERLAVRFARPERLGVRLPLRPLRSRQLPRPHIATSQRGGPTCRAISAATIKIPEPEPTIDPATSMVASSKPLGVAAGNHGVADIICDRGGLFDPQFSKEVCPTTDDIKLYDDALTVKPRKISLLTKAKPERSGDAKPRISNSSR